MTTTGSTRPKAHLCSAFSAANNEEPGGSAPSWKRCVVIELEEPWESDVARSSHFPPAVSDILSNAERRGAPTRLQCMTPDPEHSVEGHSRVMYFSRPDGPFATFRKEEFVVPVDDVGDLVGGLLEQREGLHRFERYRQDTSQFRDILVCTHGTHDVCCATLGYPVYRLLRNEYARRMADSIRVWRVSHIGGHRFAPNLVDMPEGRNWVRMGHDDLRSLISRDSPVSELRKFYRGWVGLDSPYEQLVEREIFMREGWGWAGRMVTSRLVGTGNDQERAEVRIEFADSNGGGSGAYEATVERTGSVKRVDCPGVEETGEYPQYTVGRLVKVS